MKSSLTLSLSLSLLSPTTSTFALSVAGNKAISYRVNLPCATGHHRRNNKTSSFARTYKQLYNVIFAMSDTSKQQVKVKQSLYRPEQTLRVPGD